MPTNRELMEEVFNLIERRIFFGDRIRDRQFLSLAQPAQFVDLDLDDSNNDDLFIQSDLSNHILDASWLEKRLTGSISEVYGRIMEFAELPQRILTPEQEREIRERQRVANDIVFSLEYDRFQNRYDRAWNAYHDALEAGLSADRIQRLHDHMLVAEDQWDTLGRRAQLRIHLARILYLVAGDPNVWWNDIKNLFENGTEFAPAYEATFHPAIWAPAVREWRNDEPWQTYELEVYRGSSSYRSRSTQWSGSASFGFWWFGASGGARGETVDREMHSETERFRIRFDAMKVRINRERWLRSQVFGLRSWRWRSTMSGVISSGGNPEADPPVPPSGQMPLLSTHLLVARNVEISATWSQFDSRFHSDYVAGSASVGFWPFRLSGKYERRNVEHDVSHQFDGASLTQRHPQIFGYLSTLVPRTPDPDPDLSWENDRRPVSRSEQRQLYRAQAKYLAALESAKWVSDRKAELERAHEEAIERLRVDSAKLREKRVRELLAEAVALRGSVPGRGSNRPGAEE